MSAGFTRHASNRRNDKKISDATAAAAGAALDGRGLDLHRLSGFT